tara:strand:+ start:492 stop:683 length:192 start_codon:yes stop_codon:yes gene_type:complete
LLILVFKSLLSEKSERFYDCQDYYHYEKYDWNFIENSKEFIGFSLIIISQFFHITQADMMITN